MSGEYQLIPARHGTATFVPRNHTIMIRNTYGKQVIDTWAFALNEPPKRKKVHEKESEKKVDSKEQVEKGSGGEEVKEGKEEKEVKKAEVKEKKEEVKDDAKEAKAQDAAKKPETTENEAKDEKKDEVDDAKPVEAKTSDTQKPARKATWSSYLPSKSYLPTFRSRAGAKNTKATDDEEEQTKQANTKTWLSYLPSGKGYTSYLPSSDAISAFASSHYRDPEKSYAEQLYDFSKTPVGAAGISAATGSGTASTLYAAYSAYAATTHEDASPMEYLSMSQTRTRTQHLTPKINDSLYSNLGQPLLTLIEDTTPGTHDTLIAACNPQRYRDLGVPKWEEHGSCAENLVLALKEINQKSGLKGARAVGAEVTVNSVPDPLNLFMNAPLNPSDGSLAFKEPAGGKNEFVRFRAERDIVVVMSACPMDVTPVNGGKCMVGHFMVEVDKTNQPEAVKRPAGKPSSPAKLNRNRSSQGPQPVRERERAASVQSGKSNGTMTATAGEKRKPKKLEVRSVAKTG